MEPKYYSKIIGKESKNNLKGDFNELKLLRRSPLYLQIKT